MVAPGLPNTNMDLSELTCIISKFDPLSDYSESETEVFKQPAPSKLQRRLRPCLKQAQQTLIGPATTTSEDAGIAARCRKTARFAAAHLLARCLVTGSIVPTREEERAASIDEDGLDIDGGDRRRQQRRQKRAKQRAGQRRHGSGGGNLLDDELAFHRGVDDRKCSPTSIPNSQTTPTIPEGLALKQAAGTKDEPSTKVEGGTVGPGEEGPFPEEEKSSTETDPEELALEETLVEACRNAVINSRDVTPLQSLERFAWQSRWAVSASGKNLDSND